MINTERVKNLTKIALYEQTEEKQQRQTGLFYRSDYIGKELIKSFFTGSVAYAIMLILWAISSLDTFLNSINNLEIVKSAVLIVLLYVGFLAIYLFVTYLVYLSRYKTGRARLKEYVGLLKTTNKMYEREEKLKM